MLEKMDLRIKYCLKALACCKVLGEPFFYPKWTETFKIKENELFIASANCFRSWYRQSIGTPSKRCHHTPTPHCILPVFVANYKHCYIADFRSGLRRSSGLPPSLLQHSNTPSTPPPSGQVPGFDVLWSSFGIITPAEQLPTKSATHVSHVGPCVGLHLISDHISRVMTAHAITWPQHRASDAATILNIWATV